MKRFDPETYYETKDPALRIIGTYSSMSIMRHEGRGPRYIKVGRRVLYRGCDLNEYLDSCVVETNDTRKPMPFQHLGEAQPA